MTNGFELRTYLKESKMAKEEMDLCSAGEEEYFEAIHSPTDKSDNSEDSVEVKISPIILKNKRKIAERKEEKFTGPLKKRMCLKIKSEIKQANKKDDEFESRIEADSRLQLETKIKSEFPLFKSELHPFRPWSPPKSDCQPNSPPSFVIPKVPSVFPSSALPKQLGTTNNYFRPPSPIRNSQISDEPVALLKKTKKETVQEVPRVPVHPQLSSLSIAETEKLIKNTAQVFPALKKNPNNFLNIAAQAQKCQQVFLQAQQAKDALSFAAKPSPIQTPTQIQNATKREQRNYKNMTRERRIEANARERTRVHTISAAFDTLRKSIPSYSHNQKLSKLSVLRIACSYIMTLNSIVQDEADTKLADNVECITKTIQKEGKLRKKKDDE